MYYTTLAQTKKDRRDKSAVSELGIERMNEMKLYSKEEFKKMEALKREFEETGEGELFTKNTVKRRLRVGEEKATQLFNDLTEWEVPQ